MTDTRLPIKEKNRMSWEDFLRGRLRRRQLGNQVAPEIIRRNESKDDARLRAAFDGERGPAFPTEDDLRGAVQRYFPEADPSGT